MPLIHGYCVRSSTVAILGGGHCHALAAAMIGYPKTLTVCDDAPSPAVALLMAKYNSCAPSTTVVEGNQASSPHPRLGKTGAHDDARTAIRGIEKTPPAAIPRRIPFPPRGLRPRTDTAPGRLPRPPQKELQCSCTRTLLDDGLGRYQN